MAGLIRKNVNLNKAIDLVGYQRLVAEKIGVSQGNLSDAVYYKRILPERAIIKLSLLTGLKFMPEELDPSRDYAVLYEFCDLLKGNKRCQK